MAFPRVSLFSGRRTHRARTTIDRPYRISWKSKPFGRLRSTIAAHAPHDGGTLLIYEDDDGWVRWALDRTENVMAAAIDLLTQETELSLEEAAKIVAPLDGFEDEVFAYEIAAATAPLANPSQSKSVSRRSVQRCIADWSKQRLSGGTRRRPDDFDFDELVVGARVEREHTGDTCLAMEIAMDHLDEDPRYYEKLATIHTENPGETHGATMCAWIQARLAEGLTVYVQTPLRTTKIRPKDAHLVQLRGGNCKVARGKSWDIIDWTHVTARKENPGDVDACVLAKHEWSRDTNDCGPDAPEPAVAASRLAKKRWRLPPGERKKRAGTLR